MAKGKKTGGRQAGTQNKISAALKDMVLQALANAGGVTYLESVAEKNPAAFMTLLGKILPLEVKTDGIDPLGPRPVINVHVPWRSDGEKPERWRS